MVRSASRVLLGFVLILHGLANTVLPLRGADAAAGGMLIPPVTALCVIAIVAFVPAGLGVLGLQPLGRFVVPISLVAGLAALAGQFWQAHTDLWPGVLLSATLPLLTALFVTATDGQGQARRSGWRHLGQVVGWGFLVWVVASATLWPWHRSWGTDPNEWAMALPGDHLPRTPALEIMHAVTIDAPPERVWPWLVQIGQNRGGFYSYTWLEHAFGADITNADTIHPEWQALEAGDLVYATQPNYLGGLLGPRPGWIVERVDPQRALVLRNWGAFVLQAEAGSRTRFLIRSTISNDRIPAWLAAINFMALFDTKHHAALHDAWYQRARRTGGARLKEA